MGLSFRISDFDQMLIRFYLVTGNDTGWAEGNFRWGLLSNKKNGFLSKNFTF